MRVLRNLLVLFLAAGLLGALANLGSDTSRWDCPGEPAPCEQAKP